MIKLKRKLCFALTFVMLIMIFSSCGKTNDNNNNQTNNSIELENNTLPISKNNVTLNIYVPMLDLARQFYNSYSEHPVIKEMEKQTGLKLTFVHPPQNDDGTFFNTTIASGVYPDIFKNNFNSYPGGAEGAVQDGVLINMNEYIYKYAPNFLAMLNSVDPKIQKKAFSDSKMITGFGATFQPPILENKVHSGLLMRKDLLDEAKLSVPTTIDEFTNALIAFKNSNKVKVPLAMPKASDPNWKNYSPFASAYGVQADGFFLDNGKVVYSRTQAGYKEFLKLLNSWYTQGLLDKDFTNKSQSDQEKLLNNGTAGSGFIGNWRVTQVLQLGKTVVPNLDVVGVPYPVLKKGDVLHLSDQMESVTGDSWFISKTCKNPIEATKFIDYICKNETNELTEWGVAPDAAHPLTEVVDGITQYTKFMTNNPDFDYASQRAKYTLNPFTTKWVQDRQVQLYKDPHNIEAWKNWGSNNDNKNKIPTAITLKPDESRQLSTIMNQINTYSDEYFYKFVTGVESLDKFDEYVKKIEGMQLSEAIKIEQAAYDRFMKR